MSDYAAFLASKSIRPALRGLKTVPQLREHLFAFQHHAVSHALRAGCAGTFLDTGLGKTEVQLEWCQHALEATNGRALILTPLAVAQQTRKRADRWGYEARVIRDQSEVGPGINICNYDRLDRLDAHAFGAVSLDEASILKSFTGKTTRALIDTFKGCRFKLVATATPAPNDHMELGNYAEYLEIMQTNEMLSRWFINDTSTASQEWRLKGHAENDFWDWMGSWSRMAEKPSDLGDADNDARFELPPMHLRRHRSRDTEIRGLSDGLFTDIRMSATTMYDVKRQTCLARAEMAAKVIDTFLSNEGFPCLTGKNTMPLDGFAMPLTNLSERNVRQHQGLYQTAAVKRAASKNPLGLPSGIITPSITNKTDAAQYAESGSPEATLNGFTSIIATQPERLEACSVQHATLASASLEMTQKILRGPHTTSEKIPSFLLWCDTNDEQDALESVFGDLCLSIRGSHSQELKEDRHEAWLRGVRPGLITKPAIFGLGCDWSHCAKMVFVGRTFSYETWYQSVRRCWRFGQKREVIVDLIVAEGEDTIGRAIDRKAADHSNMKVSMRAAMARAMTAKRQTKITYAPTHKGKLPSWLKQSAA